MTNTTPWRSWLLDAIRGLLKAGNAGLSTLNSQVRLVDLAKPAMLPFRFQFWTLAAIVSVAKRLLRVSSQFRTNR